LRQGMKKAIQKEDVMVGDIIYIKNGMQLPADGIIIEATEVKADESVMTGEPEAITIDTME